MPRLSYAAIRPRSVTEYDDELGCYVTRVVGYYALCQCGWRSTSRATFAAARGALRLHRGEAAHEKPLTTHVERG